MAKRTRSKNASESEITNVNAAKILRKHLDALLEEWDNTEPEKVGSTIMKAASELEDQGVAEVKATESDLANIMAHVVTERSELQNLAEKFDKLTNGYSDDPDWDEMQEAYWILDDLVAQLKKQIRRENARNQTSLDLGIPEQN
jgi:hypothetical protein